MPPPNAPAAAANSNWKMAGKVLGGGGIVIFIVVAIVWFGLRPTGTLRLAMMAQVEAEQEKKSLAFQLFSKTGPNVVYASRLHAALSFQPETERLKVVPANPDVQDFQLTDILTKLKVEADFKSGKVDTAVSIDGINLMKMLWEFAGFRDYYLVIDQVENKTCPKEAMAPHISIAPPGTSPNCYSITARIDGLSADTKEFTGPLQQISQDLALYLFKSFLRSREEIADDAREQDSVEGIQATLHHEYLPSHELSDSFASLDATSEGYRLLIQGNHHPECINDNQDDECVIQAEKLFKSALAGRADPGNPSANLGLGLVGMRQAFSEARAGESGIRISRIFGHAIRRIQAARSGSGFLDQRIFDPDWLQSLRLLSKEDIRISSDLLATGHYLNCAFNSYLAGEFSEEQVHIKGLKGSPSVFAPMITGYGYDSQLEALRDPDEKEFSLILDKLDSQRNDTDIWLYHAVYSTHACRDEKHRNKWSGAAGNARNRALLGYQNVEGAIRNSDCLRREGDKSTALGEAIRLPGLMPTVAYDEDKFNLYVRLGIFFALSREYDRAEAMLLKAVKWPFTLRRVQNEPGLTEFMQSPQFRNFQIKAFERSREFSELVNCGGDQQ